MSDNEFILGELRVSLGRAWTYSTCLDRNIEIDEKGYVIYPTKGDTTIAGIIGAIRDLITEVGRLDER